MILIEMKMPKSCDDCPLLKNGERCAVTGIGLIEAGEDFNPEKRRMLSCPLREAWYE